jgi:hypothetical protein
MDKRKRKRHERESHEHDQPEHEHERSDRDRDHSGDDPMAHAKIIERRWLGSPPPTAERYARALKQWQALPGAVVRTATNVTAATEIAGPASSAKEENKP